MTEQLFVDYLELGLYIFCHMRHSAYECMEHDIKSYSTLTVTEVVLYLRGDIYMIFHGNAC